MIQLYQFPWSPYCLVQQRILEFGDIPHRLESVSAVDRGIIWRLTRQRYYQVPILKDGRMVLFETEDNSQVLAKYLESKCGLGLFPVEWDGVQDILWRYIENDVEGMTFRLNDAYYREFVPREHHWAYVRHKERKFGRGCLDQWLQQQSQMLKQLNQLLTPFEQMLRDKPYLLDSRPVFVDFDLWGMLGNLLFSGHYQIAPALPRLRRWYRRMGRATLAGLKR